MPHLTRRTQLLLDEERYGRLERRAAASNRSVAALVRDAIDIAYPERSPSREEAFEDFLAGPLADHGGREEIKRDILARYDDRG
jgi:hypothetical protein